MLCPGPSLRASLTAPTQFMAAELPTKRPSLRMRYAACTKNNDALVFKEQAFPQVIKLVLHNTREHGC